MSLFFLLFFSVQGFTEDRYIPIELPNEEIVSNPKERPKEEFYRRITANLPTHKKFRWIPPGMKPVEVEYEIKWTEEALKNLKFFKMATPLTANVRIWTDKVLLHESGSYIQVKGETSSKVPLDCVFVDGQDNLDVHKTKPALYPRFRLMVKLGANDPECKGPFNTNPLNYTVSDDLWETFLEFQIRDLASKTPILPQFRWIHNTYALSYHPHGDLK